MISVVIPVPPSTNNLFKNAGKRRVLSDVYKLWRIVAGLELNKQPAVAMRGPVSIDLAMRRPRADADIDNRLKAPIDLLVAHGLIDDDKNVTAVSARWDAAVEGCRITVRHAPT